jgi:hypothetical protein
VAPESKLKPTSPAEIAMMLGTVIANGFIAVEAKEAEKVQDIGRRVIDLASALSVRDAVLTHCNAIIDASKKGDWLGVRAELDKTQNSVSGAMEKLNSKDQAELVSITGWLRGTQALTSLIKVDYKPERAELLHQSEMLTTFENQFKGMSPRVQGNHKVVELREGLQKIKPLIAEPQISDKSVEQINQITNGLVKTISGILSLSVIRFRCCEEIYLAFDGRRLRPVRSGYARQSDRGRCFILRSGGDGQVHQERLHPARRHVGR